MPPPSSAWEASSPARRVAALVRRVPVVDGPSAVPGFAIASSRASSLCLVSSETASYFPTAHRGHRPSSPRGFSASRPNSLATPSTSSSAAASSHTLNHAAHQSWPPSRPPAIPCASSTRPNPVLRNPSFARSGLEGEILLIADMPAAFAAADLTSAAPAPEPSANPPPRRFPPSSCSLPLRGRRSSDSQRPGHGARRAARLIRTPK